MALANAMKYKGLKFCYKKALKQLPNSIKRGTTIKEIANAIKQNNLKYKYIKPTMLKIKREIDKGRGVILLYSCNDWGHFVYMNEYSGENFTVYNNDKSGKTSIKCRKLDTYLKYGVDQRYPKAIVVI